MVKTQKQVFVERLIIVIDGLRSHFRNTTELTERFGAIVTGASIDIAKLLALTDPEDPDVREIADAALAFALFAADCAKRATPQNTIAARDEFNQKFLPFCRRLERARAETSTR